MNVMTTKTPTAVFDSLESLLDTAKQITLPKHICTEDYAQAVSFLKCYRGSLGTFNAYRREIERLLHWVGLVGKKTLQNVSRDDIEAFVKFCQNPPKNWIGLHNVKRFNDQDGLRVPNCAWRPFVVSLSKAERAKGIQPKVENYQLSQGATQETFAILSTFYQFLITENFVKVNPVGLIRQKSKFIQKSQGDQPVRRLSTRQWRYLLQATEELAAVDPNKHERTLFILRALYCMYLRISELVASQRWLPTMNDFFEDSEGNWWFKTVGKGNKARQIAVSDDMLDALKQWRGHLGLSPLPSPADNFPLIPRLRGKGPMSDPAPIRRLIQSCFNETEVRLRRDGFDQDADMIAHATVHWLRHTGISDDVKHRPREHVRDDAGHGSSAITDRYIDIELRERHSSARDKPLEGVKDE